MCLGGVAAHPHNSGVLMQHDLASRLIVADSKPGPLDRTAGVLKIWRSHGRPGMRWVKCLPERSRVRDDDACGVDDEEQYCHIVESSGSGRIRK